MIELPTEAADRAERLTRLARRATDENEAAAYRRRRRELLDEYGFVPRIREEDDTLVCYPAEWVEGGTVRLGRVEDTDRAAERSLSGPGDPEEWEAVADRNESLAERVADEAGPAHGANAMAFGEFLSNHYALRVERATESTVEEFLDDYYQRNVWPSDEEQSVVRESLAILLDLASVDTLVDVVDGDRRLAVRNGASQVDRGSGESLPDPAEDERSIDADRG